MYNSILKSLSRIVIPEEVKGKYPFVLYYAVLHNGACSSCASTFCTGCLIRPTNQKIILKNPTSLVIDWTSNISAFNAQANNHVIEHSSATAEESKGTQSLDDCFKAFLETEKLGSQDAWYCPRCKTFQEAFKKLDLWKLPEYLVIHLKRFHYDKSVRKKIDTFVDYPTTTMLDPTEYLLANSPSKNYKYKLYAVALHSGGLGSGHYTGIYCSTTFLCT